MDLDSLDDVALGEEKTLKVTVPARLHLRLHARKILTGTTISETVEQALVSYLEAQSDPA